MCVYYISYYNNPKNKDIGRDKIVAISRTNYMSLPPERICRELMPSAEMFTSYKSGVITLNEMFMLYLAELPDKVKLVNILKSYDGCILCCHEKDISQCHRFVLYHYMKELGLEVSVL